MKLFENTFNLTEQTRVLDVGGSIEIWQHATVLPMLTIANLPSAVGRSSATIAQVAADGCLLPFKDGEFDIVFSNSVIEHLGCTQRQWEFATEIARVGRSFWVQTPNQRFPIEQHLLLPFVHQLPRTWRPAILNRFTGWALLTHPTESEKRFYVHHFLNDIQLLRASDLRELFPQSQILRERVLGLTKSLVAFRKHSTGTSR